MKYIRRFLLLAAIIIIAAGFTGLLFLYTQKPMLKLQGSNSELLTRYYQSIKAREINENGITMQLEGGVPESREPGHLYMSNDLELMMPAGWLNDYLNCDVFSLEDGSVQVSLGEQSALLSPDEEGRVSVPELAQALGISFAWDEETRTAQLTTRSNEDDWLPARFDLREEGRVSPVKDQAQWATCWAFAALSAVESSLLPDTDLPLSVDHLTYHHGFMTEGNVGGDYNMALAYMTSWRGPVTEAEDPYGDEYSPEDLPEAVHVQDAVILGEQLNIARLKNLLYENGAVESAIYAQQDLEAMSGFYDPVNAAYYYSGDEVCNHDIDIIGWDDYYPKENFPEQPEGDGAFLCQNSWGEYFGDGGYFYISYYDVNIGRYGVAYTGVESTDNYDHIYQYDPLGWTGAIGYGQPEALFAAAYTADSAQALEAAGFYATDPDTWYDLYLVHDFTSAEDFADAEYVRSGYLPDKGYFTVKLGREEALAEGEHFAIVVRIRTKEATHPVAMEYAGNALTSQALISDGETYMSPEGTVWASVEEAANGNACLKAYTKDTPEK